MPHKLLLADDSVTIQRVIELTFADENIEVIAVGNGQLAIERAERDKPDIVLADVGMPERDGYEVAAFIKGNPALSHIPVVLLTGAFEPIDETRARAVGCDGVLVKPFEPQMVISRVKDLLAGQPPSASRNAAPEQGAARAPVGPAAPPSRPAPPAAAPAPASADPLEAYFDRLDAAFASMESGGPGAPPAPKHADNPPSTADHPLRRDPIPLSRAAQPPPAPSSAPLDELGSWDPDLDGDVARSAQAGPAASPAAQVVAPTPAPAPSPKPDAPQPSPAAAAEAAVQQVEAAPVSSSPAAATAAPPSLVEAFAALLAAEQRVGIAPSLAPRLDRAASDEQLVEAVTQRVLSRLTDQARPTILDVAERLVRDEIERIKRNR